MDKKTFLAKSLAYAKSTNLSFDIEISAYRYGETRWFTSSGIPMIWTDDNDIPLNMEEWIDGLTQRSIKENIWFTIFTPFGKYIIKH